MKCKVRNFPTLGGLILAWTSILFLTMEYDVSPV